MRVARWKNSVGVPSVPPPRRFKVSSRSEVARDALARQRAVLLLAEPDRVAAGGGVLDRHRRHLVDAFQVDPDVLQRMRDADLLAQRQDPPEEAVEAALDAR